MIKHLFASMAVMIFMTAHAESVEIQSKALGSGTPSYSRIDGQQMEKAVPVIGSDILHAPQYLPYHPTAATIWPRVVRVPCAKHGTSLTCEGYHWTPDMGRAEYLYITPVVTKPLEPVIITEKVMVPGPVILKEVPVKKKRE